MNRKSNNIVFLSYYLKSLYSAEQTNSNVRCSIIFQNINNPLGFFFVFQKYIYEQLCDSNNLLIFGYLTICVVSEFHLA